jgi:phenylacetate-CoA ligase
MYAAAQQTWDERARLAHQDARFSEMARVLAGHNRFYQAKWSGLKQGPINLARLEELPFTLKSELLDDQRRHGPFGTNLTYSLDRYVRFHQTSGTSGVPLRVLDTWECWNWWAECWRVILDAAQIGPGDRVMLAFSFGPFVGFWSAHEAIQRHGALVLTGGGMTSLQRLAMMRDLEATVLICTPSYALHLGEIARSEGLDPARDLKVRTTVNAGEPGAGIPATRERIETLWGAQCFDHPGASEIGAYGFSCSARRGVHIHEAEFIAEVIDPDTGRPVAPGDTGELVMTNLGRTGFPVVRYRSGDIVRPLPRQRCSCGRTSLLLEGGILGRRDDMVTIRGVNVFPSAFLALFNEVPDLGEHRLTVYQSSSMDQLYVEYEELSGSRRPDAIVNLIREKLGIRVTVQAHAPGALPRFEAKARRFHDRRREGWSPPDR